MEKQRLFTLVTCLLLFSTACDNKQQAQVTEKIFLNARKTSFPTSEDVNVDEEIEEVEDIIEEKEEE